MPTKLATPMPLALSYAQRFEDLYLLRCFGDRPNGFYIDIGAGHPVADNVSFAFYLRGWNGITAEPNPHLAQLSRAVRTRDHVHQVLVGAAAGEAAFYLVEDFHGLSSMLAPNAEAAQAQFGKPSRKLTLPVTTLQDLCAQHAPACIDFLKIDVEGAEKEVLEGGDWKRFRPRVVMLEALAPFTLAPAWDAWEPLLTANGYRHAFSDSLNRYYVAEEAAELMRHFETAPATFDAMAFRDLQPALAEPKHPDRALADLLAQATMTRLPLLDPKLVLELALAGLGPSEAARAATPADIPSAWNRLFGTAPTLQQVADLKISPNATVADLYGRLLDTETFQLACGRISASYAW
jgi:FkbM family methyltransferase